MFTKMENQLDEAHQFVQGDDGPDPRIEDTERMLEHTQRFIDQLAEGETRSRRHMEEVRAALERQVTQLRAKHSDPNESR